MYTNKVLAILNSQVLEAPFQEIKRRSLKRETNPNSEYELKIIQMLINKLTK